MVALQYKLPPYSSKTRGRGCRRASGRRDNKSAHLDRIIRTPSHPCLPPLDRASSVELLYKRSAPEILIRHRHSAAVVSPMKTHGELMVHATVYNTGYNIIYTVYAACSRRFRGPATFLR